MINVQNLSYSYPQKDLFNLVSFTIETGQHCACIGASGSGKSTLINMLLNTDKFLYDGDIKISSNHKIGYVSQFSQLTAINSLTVFDFIAEEFVQLENKISTICTQLETASDVESLLEDYQSALDAFSSIQGENYESNMKIKLNIANLIQYKDLKVSQLSGGEFKIVQVIKEMLTHPDLVIMDEPDAFLDFENLNSLKKLINSHKGTMLIITHNRYLLDHCFNKIIHLENMNLSEFDGNYISYTQSLLQLKIEQQELSYEDDKEISRNNRLIDVLREKATYTSEPANGRTLRARVKIQERLEESRTIAPFVDIYQPNINLYASSSFENFNALTISDYKISFDDVLLENINFEIQSNDKVALIGANGTGKTTLIRDIFQNNHPSIQLSPETKLAYLSQVQGEILDESNTVLQEFFDLGFESLEGIVLFLERYGFDETKIRQKIYTLSGGEKNILQWAKIASSKSNLLLLDEPTSHLDLYSQLALEKALKDYTGAVLMISHDYYSIVKSMDYILLVEDKTIRKMSMRKFRKMVYSKYFDKNYLALEDQKKSSEVKISLALKDNNFELAKVHLNSLDKLISSNY